MLAHAGDLFGLDGAVGGGIAVDAARTVPPGTGAGGRRHAVKAASLSLCGAIAR